MLLLLPLAATADDLIVSSETPAFALDTRLPSTDPGPGSLIVQFESPPFVLDTRLSSSEPPGGSLIVQAESPPFTLNTRLPDGVAPSSGTVVTESGPFTLDTRLPDGVVPSSGTVVAESSNFTLDTRLPGGISFTNGVVIAESPPFALDTRLPTDITPPASLVVTVESPPFTLDTRLPGDTTPLPNLITQTETPPFTLDTRLPSETTPLPNLITQTESPAFTLDTRIPPLDIWWITKAESGPFTLDTLSGWLGTPSQTLAGGSTGGKVRFAPDGLRLAKTDGSRVLMWNLHSTRTNFTFTGHGAEVTTVDFSPLGDQLLTGSADGTVRWWDTASRTELGRTNPPGSGTVYAAYASDGARILAGRGANATLYRVPSMQLMQEFPGSEGTISAVALCPEGLALAGNSYRSALLWDTATGAVRFHLTNHTRMVTAVAFLPGGTNAITASLDGTIRIWDTATGAERMALQQGSPAVDATLSLDGTILVTCYDGNPLLRGNGPIGTAYIWDAQTGALMRVFSDETAPSQMKGVAISPDHTALATTYADGSVRLWNTGLDPRPNYPVTTLPTGTNVPVTLRSHGLYYFAVDAQAARSLVITLEADPGGSGGAKLKGSADIPVGFGRALSSDAEFANLGPPQADKNVGAPTSKSLQSPPPGADLAAFRMTATRGKLPSQYDYESFAQASVTNLHCEIPVSVVSTGKVYVLVFAPYLVAGSISASLSASYNDLHLTSITPNRGGNFGVVTTKILGTGLASGTNVSLARFGLSLVKAASVLPYNSTKLFARFNLAAIPPGPCDVILEGGNGQRLVCSNAFEVVQGGGGALRVETVAPRAVRFGRSSSFNLYVRNDGLNDIGPFVVATYLASSKSAAPQAKAAGSPMWAGIIAGEGGILSPGEGTILGGSFPVREVGCGRQIVPRIYKGQPDGDCEGAKIALRFLKALIAAQENTLRFLDKRLEDCRIDCRGFGPFFSQPTPAPGTLTYPKGAKDTQFGCDEGPPMCEERLKYQWEILKNKALHCTLCTLVNAICPPKPEKPPENCSTCLQLLPPWLFENLPFIGDPGPVLESPSEEFCAVGAIDPNDKIGPSGVGPNRVVSTNDFMDYMVRFENMAAATAPVQELVVVDYLDPNLDWTTVQFEEIAYGDRVLLPPAGSQYFNLRDVPPTNSAAITGFGLTNLAVNISGMFNPQVGRIEWRVACVDTNTGTWPLDALAGILPPEDGTGRGQGHVRFRVKPKADTSFGTTITNIATIVFDGNDPIATPAVWNMVGDVPSLAATIAYLPGQIMAGMPFSYTVTLTNAGSTTVTNVVLTNSLPAGMTILNATASAGSVTIANGVLVWVIGDDPGGSGAVLTVTAVPSSGGTFVNDITFSGGTGLAIFSAPGTITVLPPPRLSIRLVDGQLVLSWPTNGIGFHPQKASTLSTPILWTGITNTVMVVGQECQVTLGLPSSTEFYRLANTSAIGTATLPRLRIGVAGGKVDVSWPTNAVGFRLQQKQALPPPAGWSDVTNAPATAGQDYHLQLAPSGTARFFRLVKP